MSFLSFWQEQDPDETHRQHRHLRLCARRAHGGAGREKPGVSRPGLRLALGPHLPQWDDGSEERVDLALDLVLHGRLVMEKAHVRGLMLMPELGYSYQPYGPGVELATLGFGVGYSRSLVFAFGWTPRVIIGSEDGELAWGVRHGVSVELAANLFSLEVSHQVLWTRGPVPGPRHDVLILAGIDFPGLLAVAILARAFKGFKLR